MRFLLALLTTLILMVSVVPVASAGDYDINPNGLLTASITIDGLKLDADAYILNDRTIVPLRAIFERLGATVEWDEATQTVTATKGTTVIKLTIGETEATVNGKVTTLAVPAVKINSRTFVPLRFVSEALGAEVGWDGDNVTAVIKTNSGCTLAPFQKHEGTIAKGGETWGRCGSPHVVTDRFLVQGADSPILTIEDGAIVQFEEGAYINIGADAPGGLNVNGKASNPVVFTSASAGAQPGSWNGINFFDQTLKGNAKIEGARIEYAGGTGEYNGAIYIEGNKKTVEVLVKDVEIKNSQFAGINLYGLGRLAAGSTGLKITGTKSVGGEGGFPIVTYGFGSHNLPRGTYSENDVNAVNVTSNAGSVDINSNTTWRNVSIPYAISEDVKVQGTASPTLTIEPGVITLWAKDTRLEVGDENPGHLIADAVAKPDGNGDWFTSDWRVGKTELNLGKELAEASSLGPTCGLCGQNRAIVFGAWNASPTQGAWDGIALLKKAGDKNKLNGVVVAYGGVDYEWSAGVYAEAAEGNAVKLTLSNSLITGAVQSGLMLWDNATLTPESTGNTFASNGWPVRLQPENIGTLPAGQTYTENDKQVISVWTNGGYGTVTKDATWRNQGIPYLVEDGIYISGTKGPKVTVEAGAEFHFARDTAIEVGGSDGAGSLIAVGSAGKPIKFTSESGRAGGWNGLMYNAEAGAGNRLEYVVIEYANIGVELRDDLGAFIKNTTIRSSAEAGIYRDYDLSGTSFITGLGNQFEGNRVDQNEE
jgi:hypothetical protein